MAKLGEPDAEAPGGTAIGSSSRPRLGLPERSDARQRLRRSLELHRDRTAPQASGRVPSAGAPTPSPLESVVGRDAFLRYEAALARLRPRDREAVLGRMELHWSYAELARALGVSSEETARAVVTRALGRLVEAMGG
jgi:DNA-directed RNA polymerase specialized sigma24 family protein